MAASCCCCVNVVSIVSSLLAIVSSCCQLLICRNHGFSFLAAASNIDFFLNDVNDNFLLLLSLRLRKKEKRRWRWRWWMKLEKKDDCAEVIEEAVAMVDEIRLMHLFLECYKLPAKV
ncbi:hypothetical protein L6452_07374 [Arctium lappa]|uniref:Uncharacterized protein n=1 Tax=Arctium lappa TaxID=4217 RepID=A0ACB9ELD7_ARCLA|nr:hypothetical protein L6452_07374 [Arctium lappa]